MIMMLNIANTVARDYRIHRRITAVLLESLIASFHSHSEVKL